MKEIKMLKQFITLSAGLSLLLLTSQCTMALSVSDADLHERDQWVAAKFKGQPVEQPGRPGLVVLQNYGGPVQQNGSKGQPILKIANTVYTRGLYCHAHSRIIVQLPGPGKSFTAQVGIDTLGHYSGGSVIFIVESQGKELCRSNIKLRGQAAEAIKADLQDATEFTLIVNDGGDNINSDQAGWANAKVTLADGKEIWLGDMELINDQKQPYNSQPPFSFTYDGQSSRQFLSDWKTVRNSKKIDTLRTGHTLTYTDPQTGLQVRCEAVEYQDYPTVEWVLYFKNTSDVDTPIIANIQAMDSEFSRGSQSEYVLRSISGDRNTADSYQPFTETLSAGSVKKLACTGGRPTQVAFPYYNIAWAEEGLIYVLSWAGQWNAGFMRDEGLGLTLTGGQELTHFKLLPGEEVRSPLVVLQFYKGDWLRGQNIWRRWMYNHNLPKPNGKLLQPQMSLCNGNFFNPSLMTVASTEMEFIKRHAEAKLDIDVWWQDAGWYPCDGVGWPKTGTWEPDPVRFPNGIKEISDLARSFGMKTMLWFEPERVAAGTWIAENHPEWIHGGAGDGLLKLGDPECRKWLTRHISRLLTEQGIDLYRQDFNINPLRYWRQADSEDRQGITEIRHVEGYFAFWDGLLADHPGMLIDSCASGGRRNDLETLRRAVPLLRSDYYSTTNGQQGHTYGLSFWLPYQGAPVIYSKETLTDYWVRSSWVSAFTFGPDVAGMDMVDWKRWKELTDEWRTIAHYFLGDYYPLTSYSLRHDVWMAWQFNREDLGEGVVQAYRRPECFYESARLTLHGLEPDARYMIRQSDDKGVQRMTGRELMENGLKITLEKKPEAVTIIYKKI